jgi:hypothetical protein
MAALRAAGVTAVGRYIGWDSVSGFPSIGKNISTSEIAELHGAGITPFVSFEYASDAPSRGSGQGSADGNLATKQMAALGAPPLLGVYFACDWDMPDYDPGLPDTAANARKKLGPVGDYFATINEQAPTYRVGGYGSYYAVKRLFDAGLITLGWQTVAWSGGQRDTRAQLYQTTGHVSIGGADLDIHEGNAADFGQWITTQPVTNWTETLVELLPVLQQGATGADAKSAQGLLGARGHVVAVDGNFGPATKAAVQAFQTASGLANDGIVGQQTWTKLLNR